MESLDQSYGFLLYRKRITEPKKGKLAFGEIRDYGLVSHLGKTLGMLDRRLKQTSLDVVLANPGDLDVLVENMGRINFGPRIVDDRKGIIGPVTLDGQKISDWDVFRLPMQDLRSLRFSRQRSSNSMFFRGSFSIDATGDTFLDMSGWEKGHVWVNGHHLGRFWKIGPQQTLFVPGVWLRKGRNEVIVMDVGNPKVSPIRGVEDMIFANQ